MAEVGALQSIFLVQNYTENTNGYVPLTVGNVWHLSVFEFKVRTCSFIIKYFYSMTLV